MCNIIKYFILVIFCINFNNLYSQKIIDNLQYYDTNFSPDKMYLHTDKPFYNIGETMYFKLYITNKQIQATNSTTVYVDIYFNQQLLKHIILPINNFYAVGSFEIPYIDSIAYIQIQAYTENNIAIDSNNVYSKIIPINKNIEFHFSPDSNVIFYPEGGSYCENIKTKMAFKIFSHENDTNIQGVIQDNEGNFIDSFKSIYNGMGYFFITPESTKKYFAILKSANYIDSFYLPKPLPTGVCMQIIQDTNQYKINLQNTETNNNNFKKLHIIVTNKYELLHYISVNMQQKNNQTIAIDKINYPMGVIRFTLFTDNWQPIAERMVYNYKPNEICTTNIFVDSVIINEDGLNACSIHLNDTTLTNLSISIFVDTTEKDNTEANIIGTLWLEEELKTKILNPNHYFDSRNKNKERDIDLLMLTNHWQKYNWQKIISDTQNLPKKSNKKFMQLTGKLINNTKQKIPKKESINFLIVNKDSTQQIYSVKTNEQNNFVLDNLIIFDTNILYYSFNNKKQAHNYTIELNKSNFLEPIPLYQKTLKNIQISPIKDTILTKPIKPTNNTNNFFKVQELKEVEVKTNLLIKKLKELDNNHTTGLFKGIGADSYSFDLLDDSNKKWDLFTYLRSKYYKINVLFENGYKYLNIAGSSNTYLFLNDRLIIFDEIQNLNPKDLAYMKVYGPIPGFFGHPCNGNLKCSAICLYTKNAKEYTNSIESIKQTQLIGYTKTKEFYNPTKEEVNNINYFNQQIKTLYWNNNIELSKNKPNYTINFYAPKQLKNYTIIVESMDDLGRLVYIKKQVER